MEVYFMAKAKEHMNLAFIGHVDHGKSTLVGHILLQSGAIAEKQLSDGENKFRFVMDKLQEERERGVTIDLAHAKFDTPKYEFTIVDCPGHRDFVKNFRHANVWGTSVKFPGQKIGLDHVLNDKDVLRLIIRK